MLTSGQSTRRQWKPEFTCLIKASPHKLCKLPWAICSAWWVRETHPIVIRHYVRPAMFYTGAVGKGSQESFWTLSISTFWWPILPVNLWMRSYSFKCSTFKLLMLLSPLSTSDCTCLQCTIYTCECNPKLVLSDSCLGQPSVLTSWKQAVISGSNLE